MRGADALLSRLPAVLTFAVLTALAAIPVRDARARPAGHSIHDDTALAIPRLAPHGMDGVVLPHPLAPSDAARIRRVLALPPGPARDQARIAAATAADDPLVRAVLDGATSMEFGLPPETGRDNERGVSGGGLSPLGKRLRDMAWRGRASQALALASRAASANRQAELRAGMAQGLFFANDDEGALREADAAMQTAPDLELAGFVAGLAAWRLGQPALARVAFESAAEAASGSAALQAAAAFWAARAHLRTGDAAGYIPWMTRAASHAGTFYGLLARHTLGLGLASDTDFAWGRETLSEADVAAIAATPEGERAFALLQLNQRDEAEQAFRRLWLHLDSGSARHALLRVVRSAKLPDLAKQMAGLLGNPVAPSNLDLPVPRLKPDGGFRLNPALVYALARVESNFDAGAVSSAGARGLMQISPASVGLDADGSAPGTDATDRLADPATNLKLGQRYVLTLSHFPGIKGDLIRMLAGYNSGPGNLARWSADIHDQDDPLLFLEAIPIDETRAFVPAILTNMWLYAARFGRPAPSLDELAAGAWPRFVQKP